MVMDLVSDTNLQGKLELQLSKENGALWHLWVVSDRGGGGVRLSEFNSAKFVHWDEAIEMAAQSYKNETNICNRGYT